MASTDTKKLPDAWFTASFYQTLLSIFVTLILLLGVSSVLDSKFPFQIISGIFSLIYPMVILQTIKDGKYLTNSLFLSGNFDSEKQRNNLRDCIIGLSGGYVCALTGVYFFATSQPHPIVYAIMFFGANVSGYFLTMWLHEALGMYAQLQTAIRSAGAFPVVVAKTPVAPVVSPLAAYKPMTPNIEAQAVRVGIGGEIDP